MMILTIKYKIFSKHNVNKTKREEINGIFNLFLVFNPCSNFILLFYIRIHTCMAYIRKLFKRFGFSGIPSCHSFNFVHIFLILIIKSSVECYICKNIICSNVYSILITAVCHIYCFLTENLSSVKVTPVI